MAEGAKADDDHGHYPVGLKWNLTVSVSLSQY